jgi:hypothetical protein
MYIRIALIAVAMFSVLAIACKSSNEPNVPAAQVSQDTTTVGETAKVNEPPVGTLVGDQTVAIDNATIPLLPVMTLGYQNGIIEGTQGSYCWPSIQDPNTGDLVSLCADAAPLGDLSGGVPVKAGDTLTALIEADNPASELSARLITSGMAATISLGKLDADGTIIIPDDLPSDVYALILFGRWDEGDASYHFNLNVSGVASFAADKLPIDGRCRPAMDMRVSVGDHWTLTGPTNIPDGFPSELPPGVAEMSTIVFVEGIESVTKPTQRNGPPVDQVSLSAKVTEITRDSNGEVLSSETNTLSSAPLSVSNLGPVLTPDWACHQVAWKEGWPEGMEASTGERLLDSGIIAMVFSIKQPFVIDTMGIDAVMEIHYGYDMATGRTVLVDSGATGLLNGQPFEMSMYLEIVDTPGAPSIPNNTSPEREAKIIFLTQEPSAGPRSVMQALMFGTLVSDNGCLRVKDMNSDESHLVIWPPDSQLADDSSRVLNEAGETVAIVGQGVRLSGGGISSIGLMDQQAQGRIPDKCVGPVWSVGDEVSIADLKSDLNAPIRVASHQIPDSVPLGEQDAFLRDAQSYAEDMNVSLDEAVRRLELQNSIGELGSALAANERDTFGGLWVQNSPDYRVIVRFTRDGEATIRRYVESGPFADVIDVRGADATLVELRQAQVDAERILLSLGINSYSGVDVIGNRVEVFVSDTASLDRALKNSGSAMPPSVRIMTVDMRGTPATDGNS